MKRVLYVLANEPTGGVGVFVRDYCAHFSDRVHVDYLICTETRDSAFQNAIRREDTVIYYLPEYTVKNLPMLKRRTDEFFRVRAREYDAVHLTYPGQMRLVLGPARRYGIPVRVLHSFNAKLSDDPLKSFVNKALLAGWRKYATHYLACSVPAAEYLYGKKAVKNGEIMYVRNAVDCEMYRYDEKTRESMRKECGIGEKTKVFLAAGRFEAQKNISFAVDVFARIHEEDHDSRLFLIGDGPLKGEIEARVSTYGLADAVTFTGFTDRLNDYFCAADVLLFPSLYEGLPLTVIDAQCCGLPCVLSDTISDEVVLTDLISLMSLKEDPGKWARQCLGAIRAGRRSRIGEITAKGYNVASEAAKLEEVYLSSEDR